MNSGLEEGHNGSRAGLHGREGQDLELSNGKTFEIPKPIRISEEGIRNFSQISGDNNNIHSDNEFAREMGFEGKIAQGLYVKSLAIGELVRAQFLKGTLILAGEDNWAYSEAVRPGDAISATYTLTATQPAEQAGNYNIKFFIRLRNQYNKTVQYGTALFRLRTSNNSHADLSSIEEIPFG